MSDDLDVRAILDAYDGIRHDLRIFMLGAVQYIAEHPSLVPPVGDAVHSYRTRLKSPDHLLEKVRRKRREGRNIDESNLFEQITDLAGVRILHIFQDSFVDINSVIRKRVSEGDWYLVERPKAYTWDPENVEFFERFDVDVSQKSTSYTSVHYVVRPRKNSPISCEIQVRTLFEEIWGEVDHQINYPRPTSNMANREQLKVLSKVVGAGSRLLDSIRRVHGA